MLLIPPIHDFQYEALSEHFSFLCSSHYKYCQGPLFFELLGRGLTIENKEAFLVL